jgi:anti-sigma B factor antagonist
MHRGSSATARRPGERKDLILGGQRELFESDAMTERPPMEINVRESGGIYVLEVHGRLTIGEPSDQLTNALDSAIGRGARKVIVNLNGVPQIDSSGISSLVRISIRLARENGALHLVCGPGRVRDALTVTRLVEAIPTFDSDPSALKSFP